MPSNDDAHERTIMTTRQLTHDERKAAHAAFTGQPFHDAWSSRARAVYDGIRAELDKDPVRQTPLAQQPLSNEPVRTFTPSETDQPRPLQVWHLTLSDPPVQLLFMFPWHLPMPAVLHYLTAHYPHRSMTLQAIEGGQVSCTPDHSLILARPIVSSQETTVQTPDDPPQPTSHHA